MGLRLTLQHGREAHICKGVHGGATQSLKPLLAAGVVEGGGYEGGERGGALLQDKGKTCKGIDGDASQSGSSQACGRRHKGGVLGQGTQDVLQQQRLAGACTACEEDALPLPAVTRTNLCMGTVDYPCCQAS